MVLFNYTLLRVNIKTVYRLIRLIHGFVIMDISIQDVGFIIFS